MKLENKLEVRDTLKVGVLPTALTSNLSVLLENEGLFQKRTLGSIINRNENEYLPSFSSSFPDIFNFNTSTTYSNQVLNVSLKNQVKNTVFAAPTNLNGTPAFRMLEDSDLTLTSLSSKANANGNNLTDIPNWKNVLGINDITGNYIPYIGANQTINTNTQEFLIGGRITKYNTVLERNIFGTGTSNSNNLRRYNNVAHYIGSNNASTGIIRIVIPIINATMWNAQLSIQEYISVPAGQYSNARRTTVTFGAYNATNASIFASCDNANRIAKVEFGRDSLGNTIVNIHSNEGMFRYERVILDWLQATYTNSAGLDDKSNYSVSFVPVADIPTQDFTLTGEVLNSQFQRDSYYLDYNNLTNKPTIPNGDDYYRIVKSTSDVSNLQYHSQLNINTDAILGNGSVFNTTSPYPQSHVISYGASATAGFQIVKNNSIAPPIIRTRTGGNWLADETIAYQSWTISNTFPINHLNRVNSAGFSEDFLNTPTGTYSSAASTTATNRPFTNVGGLISFGSGNQTTRILGARDNSDNLWFQSGDGTGAWRKIASKDYTDATFALISDLGNYFSKIPTNISPASAWDNLYENQIVNSTSGANSPFSQYGIGLNLSGTNGSNNNLRAQLFFNTQTGYIQFRTSNLTTGFTEVRTVWDNNNFNPNNYLPLAGGTMTGTVNFTDNSSNYPSIRKNITTTGGWNREMYGLQHTDGTVIGGLYAYGSNNSLNYFHFGVGTNGTSHNGTMFKFGNNGLAIGLPSTTVPTRALDVTGEIAFRSLNSAGFLKTDASGVLSVDTNVYALASSLGSYLPLAGGTMTGDINWNVAGFGLSKSGDKRIVLRTVDTVISAQATGTTSGIIFRPQGSSVDTGAMTLRADGLIISANDGISSQWKQAFDWGNHALAGYLTSANTIGLTYNQGGFLNVNSSVDVDTLNGSQVFLSTSAQNLPFSGSAIIQHYSINSGTHVTFAVDYINGRNDYYMGTGSQTSVNSNWVKFLTDKNISAYLPTVNDGLLTISTSADLTGSGTFSANQATASNVNIGLSTSTLASLALANTAVQPSALTGYVPTSRTLTAGNGLTGGGTLTANRTFTLGTPSAITSTSTNSVTSTSHTHAFTPGGLATEYIKGDGTFGLFPTSFDSIFAYSTQGGLYTTNWNSFALGDKAISIGFGAVANTTNSIVIGSTSFVGGFGSVNVGYSSAIKGSLSSNLGHYNNSNALMSNMVGLGLESSVEGLTVIGRYNKPLPSIDFNTSTPHLQPVFLIGKGRDETERSNAITVFGDGRADYESDYNTANWKNETLVTKKYVDDAIAGGASGVYKAIVLDTNATAQNLVPSFANPYNHITCNFFGTSNVNMAMSASGYTTDGLILEIVAPTAQYQASQMRWYTDPTNIILGLPLTKGYSKFKYSVLRGAWLKVI